MTSVGIDIGFINLGLCVLPLHDLRTPILWRREQIFHGGGKPTEEQLFHCIFKWCLRNAAILKQAKVIAIESQMQARFKIMNTVIRTLYPEPTVLVHPRTLIAAFGLRHQREGKKQDTILWCNLLFDRKLPATGKVDDMADAALMALYAAEQLD